MTKDLNGCHSTVAPMNRKHELVVLPKYPTPWPYRFTRDCQYDHKDTDKRCAGCDQVDDWNEDRLDVIGQNGNEGLHYA